MSTHILALDQGTTSTRALVFDKSYRVVGTGQQEFAQHFPHSGYVEHEAEDLIETSIATMREALTQARISAEDVAAIGITNQRETTVVWDRETGKAIHRAIVWQDRRTAQICAGLKTQIDEAEVTAKTGLLLDPYFSATKAAWILDQVEGARQAANDGKLAFGTVDSWLIWRLTGGKVHATDATNASRTNLFNIHTQDWDDSLLELFQVPQSLLPEVKDCADQFGMTDPDILGTSVPILGIAGDQQAAVIGQACFTPGSMKSTYGTGCFALLNTGADAVTSTNRLLTTVAYRLGGKPVYALEGSIFVAGAAVQWLRDSMKLIGAASEVGPLSDKADPEEDVVLVPAFTGLGAPYWDPDARGAIYGLTRNTGPAEFAKAALDSVAYQTADLLDAMQSDWPEAQKNEVVLRVDGGMTASNQAMQRLADVLGAPVDRPIVMETTALGAAWLAGFQAGVWPDQDGFAKTWRLDRTFTPGLDEAVRSASLTRWRDCVRRTLSAP